jgi:hypothetical protein
MTDRVPGGLSDEEIAIIIDTIAEQLEIDPNLVPEEWMERAFMHVMYAAMQMATGKDYG